MVPDSGTARKLHCSACGYSLHNLPEWHTCPECGVAYDPHSRIYNVAETGKHVREIVAAVLLGLFFLVGSLHDIRAGTMPFKDLLTLWGFLLALSLSSICGLVRSTGGPCRVLVNHQGIRFEHPGAKPLDVSWKHFGWAQYGRITSRLNIWDPGERQLLRRIDQRIGSPPLRRKLASEINALAEVYRST